MSEFLKHPFILLLTGFALTGLIVPTITRWWQIRQKELEIKIELVSEISESVMKFVMAIQFSHIAARSYGNHTEELSRIQHDLNNSYHEWEVRSAVIGTKLQAYLPDTSSIPEEWTDFGRVMQDFYAQEGMPKGEIQTFAVSISDRLSKLLGGETVGHKWDELKDAILKKKSNIIASILACRRLNIGILPLLSLPNLRLHLGAGERST